MLDALVSNRGIWEDVNNMQTRASSGKSNNKRIFKISFYCHAEGKVAKGFKIKHLSNYIIHPKIRIYNFNTLFKIIREEPKLVGKLQQDQISESFKITLTRIKISNIRKTVVARNKITETILPFERQTRFLLHIFSFHKIVSIGSISL